MEKIMKPILQEDLNRVPIGTKIKYKMYDFLKQKEVLYKGGILKKVNENEIIIENKNGFKKSIPKMQMFQGKPFYKTFFYKIVKKPLENEMKGGNNVCYEEKIEEIKPVKPVKLINEAKITETISSAEKDLLKMIKEQEKNIKSYKLKINNINRVIKHKNNEFD